MPPKICGSSTGTAPAGSGCCVMVQPFGPLTAGALRIHTTPSPHLWCGDGVVWILKAPAVNGPNGWTITQQPAPAGAVPVLDPQIFGGILGKWRYMPGYDVMVAVASIEGDIWVYKPAAGWVPPSGTDQAPTISITSPAAGASLALGQAVTISAN